MRRESHRSLPDNTFQNLFETYQLPKGSVTHEAHLRIAWMYLTQVTYEEALKKIRYFFNNYSQRFGDGTKYHETITVAYMQLIHKQISVSNYYSWEDFLIKNPELLKPVDQYLLPYYSKELLYSEKARKKFVAPDQRSF